LGREANSGRGGEEAASGKKGKKRYQIVQKGQLRGKDIGKMSTPKGRIRKSTGRGEGSTRKEKRVTYRK